MLVVGGKFDDNGGKSSGYVNKLSEALSDYCDVEIHNGGSWEELRAIHENISKNEILLWLPDVPNDKPKLIQTIKTENPTVFLVTSKNNSDGKHEPLHLVARALQSKSNLLIEFNKKKNNVYATLYDPLGNVFIGDEDDIGEFACVLYKRIGFLTSNITRIGSECAGEHIDPPDISHFSSIVRNYADTFHNLIHTQKQSRMLGNCSFRCTHGGFPSMRTSDKIFVSRRNLNKRDIGRNGFVAVEPITPMQVINCDFKVEYYGDTKPSVDTPVQLILYALFPNINYILHSHVYIDSAPFTHHVLPCGAIEEAPEICDVVWNASVDSFSVNLRGHGSIIASSDLEGLQKISFVKRNIPEKHEL